MDDGWKMCCLLGYSFHVTSPDYADANLACMPNTHNTMVKAGNLYYLPTSLRVKLLTSVVSALLVWLDYEPPGVMLVATGN